MTLTSDSTTVTAALLHTASQREIARAVDDLWPDRNVVLGPQRPSVTSYVCQVNVDGQEFMAKYSWLGLSLVSILRGAGGTWEQVQAAQDAYVHGPDLLAAREAENLAFLRTVGRLRVCETAGVHRGVLLTRPAPGVALADVLAARPAETGTFLESVLLVLGELHDPAAGARSLREAALIGERSVVTVFRRKFSGRRGAAYLRALGRDSGFLEAERLEVVELVQNAVGRLLHMSRAISPRRDTLVFGDLKPEHAFFDGARVTFIDPAVQRAGGSQPDVAKLIGRSLLLALGHPQPEAGRRIVHGVAGTLGRHVAGLPAHGRAAYLREVMVLWAMDTVSILTTCLSAPPGLPLAPHQQVLVGQARKVARVVDRVSALLVGSMSGLRLLDTVLSEVERAVVSTR